LLDRLHDAVDSRRDVVHRRERAVVFHLHTRGSRQRNAMQQTETHTRAALAFVLKKMAGAVQFIGRKR
jgi:hypothetical protein